MENVYECLDSTCYAKEKGTLKNLMEKYLYELSQYENTDVNDVGLYGYALDSYLDKYWAAKNWFQYFIKIDGKLAGFVMVSDRQEIELETNYTIENIFLMYKYRKRGISKYVIKYILDEYRGKWQINS